MEESVIYAERLSRAIAFIEQNLGDPLDLKEIAAEAHFSLYHFHRVFRAMTGHSLKGYIRKRRLCQAARALLESSDNILNIALGAGYESQESFSRAFKSQYGVSPGAYRSVGRNLSVVHVEALNLQNLFTREDSGAMEPKIVEMEEFSIVGMKYSGPNANGELVQHWNAFAPHMGSIPNMIHPERAFGICEYSPDPSPDGEHIDYIAARQVSSLDDIPEGMVGKVIPARSYAVFTHSGPVTTLMDTMKYIFGTWLPASNYELAPADDFELYDERFTGPMEDNAQFDICIPIKI